MTETDRGTEWPTKTNSEGIYVFPRLPVGNYDLKVEAAGFKTSVKNGIRLEVNLHTTFDIALQVGATSESVSVTRGSALAANRQQSGGRRDRGGDHRESSSHQPQPGRPDLAQRRRHDAGSQQFQ